MISLVVDIFSDDILDYLHCEDIDNMMVVFPGIIKMYKASFLDTCLSYAQNVYIECSHCNMIRNGKYRNGSYICGKCLSKIIMIPIF